MRKLFKRFIAYSIDMLVILIITQSISGIPTINKQLNDYNKYSNKYLTNYKEYSNLKVNLNKYFEDKKINDEEYTSLIKEANNYTNIFKDNYKEELSNEDYDKINKKIDKLYNNTYKEIYYKMEKNSIMYNIIYLVVVILYFVGFNKYTNGQTLGKKLMRLKIVNNNDSNKDVPVWSYIVRLIILYQPILYITKLIGVSLMDISMYYTVTNYVYTFQSYLEMIVIATMSIRIDGRGLQDMLAKTRVVLYDRNGNEIKDKLEVLVNDKLKNKKVIDEEPTE